MGSFSISMYSCQKQAYCLGENIGFVKNGKFKPIPYDEEAFSQIVNNVIAAKKCCKPEDVLRKALKIYVEATLMAKRYQGSKISESIFYDRWLKFIANSAEFKEARLIAILKQKQEVEKLKKARLRASLLNMHPPHCTKR